MNKDELNLERDHIKGQIKSMHIKGFIYFIIILFTFYTIIIPIILIILSINNGQKLSKLKLELNKIEHRLSKFK